MEITVKLLTNIWNAVIWLIASVVWGLMIYHGTIGFWGTVLILFMVFNITITDKKEAKKSEKSEHVDHGPAPMDKSDNNDLTEEIARLRAQIDESIRRQSQWQARERARERAAQHDVKFDRPMIELIRNTLFRHHNMKGTDKEYQESKTGKDTTILIQKMNDLLK